MRVMVLGPAMSRLRPTLAEDEVVTTEGRVSASDITNLGIEMIVSYGYRFLVEPEVLEAVGGRALNLHISLLPWNRGADPNLWSWLENTPKGVTVHWMSAGLDRGDLVAQRALTLDRAETLRTSYERLQDEVTELFTDLWTSVRAGTGRRYPQQGGGSYHRSADKARHFAALPLGWDTTCGDVEDYGRHAGLHAPAS